MQLDLSNILDISEELYDFIAENFWEVETVLAVSDPEGNLTLLITGETVDELPKETPMEMQAVSTNIPASVVFGDSKPQQPMVN